MRNRPLSVISHSLGILSAVMLFGLGVITVFDVLGRYFLGTSVLGAVEITTMMLVGVAFLGLASAEIHGAHVSVRLVEDQLRRTPRLIFSGLRFVVLLFVAVVLIVGLYEVMMSAMERGETTNDILRLATWPAKAVIFISFVLFFAVTLVKEANTFLWLKRQNPDASPSQLGDSQTDVNTPTGESHGI